MNDRQRATDSPDSALSGTDTGPDAGPVSDTGTESGISGVTSDVPPEPAAEGQHEESFVVRLLVDSSGVRATSVRHARSDAEERWSAWEPSSVVGFIEAHVGTRGSASAIAPFPVADPRPGSPGERVRDDEVPAPAAADPGAMRRAVLGGRGSLEPIDATLSMRIDPTPPVERTPFTVALSVGAAGTAQLPADPVVYRAILSVRPLDVATDAGAATDTTVTTSTATGTGTTELRGEGLLDADSPTIRLTGPGLPTGWYRFDSAVSLRAAGTARPLGVATVRHRIVEVTGRSRTAPGGPAVEQAWAGRWLSPLSGGGTRAGGTGRRDRPARW